MKKLSFLIALAIGLAGSWAYAADDKKPDDKKPADAAAKETKDAKESKIDGKWEGKISGPDGQEMKLDFVFSVKGEKLTGSVKSTMGGELKISEGKVKGDDISFSVEFGEDQTIEHKGKYADGKIKLKSESPMGEMEIVLTKVVDINGKWISKFEIPDGDEMEITYTFKSDGKKLTGSIESPMGELEIANGKIKGDEFSFDLEFGENAIEHKGKIMGDKIKLTVPGFGGGEEREQILKRVVEKAKDKAKEKDGEKK